MHLREHWSSRTAFVLAAIGSAIGIGNLIRFPYVCAENGGGAFLIAYLIALVTAGVPIMILEFGLGHSSGGSAPKAFRKIHPKLEWLGWVASGVGFVIVVYYAVIMAWSFSCLFDSFSVTEWAKDFDTANAHQTAVMGVSGLKGFQAKLLIGLILTWIAIVASVWKGATTVSKVVYWTVIIPWVILVIFVIRGLMLPGAWEGVKEYLRPEMAMLFGKGAGKVWLAAYTQVFFSLSIGFGIMIAYSSFLPKKSDLVKNALIICAADSLTAFVSGLAVYSCLGQVAAETGKQIADLPASLGLAFQTYPYLIAKLPFAEIFAFLFFAMVLLLGIDSAFSLLESFAASVRDKWGMIHWKANLFVGGLGLLLGLPLITSAGANWLGTIDHFFSESYGLALVGLAECFVVAWFYGCKKLRSHINHDSDIKVHGAWDVMIMFIAPLALLVFLVMETIARVKGTFSGSRWVDFFCGWLLLILLPIMGLFFQAIPWARKKDRETIIESFEEN